MFLPSKKKDNKLLYCCSPKNRTVGAYLLAWKLGFATATTTVSEWILRGRLAVREMVLMNASAALYAAGKV